MPIPTCEGCPLYQIGRGFVPDQISAQEEYVIFGEAPGTTEINEGSPFVGKAGFVLKNWLMRAVSPLQIALEKNRISFRNILHCLPPEQKGRPYPTGHMRRDAEAHCKQYHSEIKALVVVLAGEVPQRFFFSEELEREDASDKRLGREAKGVMGRIGRVYERYWCNNCYKNVEIAVQFTSHFQGATNIACSLCEGKVTTKRWIFAPHPAYILRQPALVQHGQMALRIAVGQDKELEPQILDWACMLREILS